MILRWHKRASKGAARALCAALLILCPATALAQAKSCVIPDRTPVPRLEKPGRGEKVRKTPITGYMLALSWSPEHCSGVRNPKGARDRFQCSGDYGRFGWILHGLWPETDHPGYPQWCRPAKIVPQPVLRRHLCMTPSAQLLQHEWAKHGTCMSPHPAAYFKASQILFDAVKFPDMKKLSAHPQTAGSIRAAFAAANKGIGPAMIGVTVDGQGWLKEVRLCFGARMRPQRCKPFQAGAGERRRVRVRPPA